MNPFLMNPTSVYWSSYFPYMTNQYFNIPVADPKEDRRRRRASAPHGESKKPSFHNPVKHWRRHSKIQKEAAKYGKPWWKTEEFRKEHAQAEEKAYRDQKHDELVARITELHRLQEPTHVRVWDHSGRSFLKRVRRRRGSSAGSEESIETV
ncbi:hypothetical protein SCUP234_04457 [Seiridium cupressi]